MGCIRYEIHLDDSDTFIVIAAKGQLPSEERPTTCRESVIFAVGKLHSLSKMQLGTVSMAKKLWQSWLQHRFISSR